MPAIDKSRKQRLRACERVLTDHMEEFVKVGSALKEIKREGLYKEDGFKSFEDYCRKKWEISRAHAYRLIDASEIRLSLPRHQAGDTRWTEASIRELKRLGSVSKAKAVASRVVKQVAKEGKELSSRIVRKHVDDELGTDRRPKPKPKTRLQDAIRRWTGQLNGIADLLDEVEDRDLTFLGEREPYLAKDFVTAIERLQGSLERVWASLP